MGKQPVDLCTDNAYSCKTLNPDTKLFFMLSSKEFRKLALSFPEAVELPHFEKTSFRIGKKIFATLTEKENKACLKLSAPDQDVFTLFDKSIIYPVPNKWGKQGWTFVELTRVRKKMLIDVLTTAYYEVAPKRLRKQYYNNDKNAG